MTVSTGPIEPNRLYSLSEVAELTNANKMNVKRWLWSGNLKATRVGYMYVVRGSDLIYCLQRWLRREIELSTPETGLVLPEGVRQ